MRYNNWRYDDLSLIVNCSGSAYNNTCSPQPRSPMFGIASRADLMHIYPTAAENIAHYGAALVNQIDWACFGATDSKIASWKNRNSMTSRIINGPTNDHQYAPPGGQQSTPTFDWSNPTTCGGCVPVGAQAVLDNPWVEYTPAL